MPLRYKDCYCYNSCLNGLVQSDRKLDLIELLGTWVLDKSSKNGFLPFLLMLFFLVKSNQEAPMVDYECICHTYSKPKHLQNQCI